MKPGLPESPTSPPQVLFKTLDEVEPRTLINTLPFAITEAGSYYFAENLVFAESGGDAITITSSNVTLDLNGFTLSSRAEVTGSAIAAGSALSHLCVRNGTIQGNTTTEISRDRDQDSSASGGGFRLGVNAPDTNSTSVLDLKVTGCRSGGISAGEFAIIERCIASQNGRTGIAANHATINQCIARENTWNGISG